MAVAANYQEGNWLLSVVTQGLMCVALCWRDCYSLSFLLKYGHDHNHPLLSAHSIPDILYTWFPLLKIALYDGYYYPHIKDKESET